MTVGQWIKVADVVEVEPGMGLRVDIDDVEPLAVWNVDGELYVTADTCTHEEASLTEGELWGETVECYLHGAQFDVRTGNVLSLPAVLPLRTYPVRVEDGAVYVEVSGHG